MFKIFALRNDYENYQDLDLLFHDVTCHAPDDLDFEVLNNFSLNNMKLDSWWVAPKTTFDTNLGLEGTGIPDISQWEKGTLILSPRAYRLLGDILEGESEGEFLPVNVADEVFYIFNCFVFGDEENVEFDYYEGKPVDLVELTFTTDTAEKLLFKSKSQNCVTLFCNDRFKNIVEEFGLKGIEFDKDLLPPSLASMMPSH